MTFSFLEILGFIVIGAGTLASILGIFFAIYAKQNGKITREFIKEENQNMREFMTEVITRENQNMREFMTEVITRENQNMREFISEIVTCENRETQKLITEVIDKIDQRADERHKEMIEFFKTK